ncbi:hypothetical protein [Ferruginibacter sp. SUN106]|uniref:hypothetical protein n=1 Tax=Ferruginibacter sp. SUN106 TaxID=2978348 RepID=UPI003D35E95B
MKKFYLITFAVSAFILISSSAGAQNGNGRNMQKRNSDNVNVPYSQGNDQYNNGQYNRGNDNNQYDERNDRYGNNNRNEKYGRRDRRDNDRYNRHDRRRDDRRNCNSRSYRRGNY